MGLEFMFPWALLLLPVAIGLTLWIERKYRQIRRSLKNRVNLALRLLLVTMLVMAIAGPSILLPSGANVTWILLDVSDSTASAQDETQQRLVQAMAQIPQGEQVGVIAFGANARVEAPLSWESSFSGVRTAVRPEGSNLSEALRLAGALTPEESAGRIVVVSDGQTDNAKAIAAALAARGIVVDALKMHPSRSKDAQITHVKTPKEVYEGQSFTIEVTVDSTLDTTATLVLYQNHTPTATREVTLRKGQNIFAFQDVASQTGVMTYEVRLLAQGDEQGKNNSASAYLHAAGTPHVLLVEGKPGSGREMGKMLASGNMNVETVRPQELPMNGEELRKYDSIVLANVDYDTASEEQWQALEVAVRVLGRGLCVLGGDSSYALGGYRGSLLETMLPVTIDVRSKLQMPSLSLMLVIDKSGSMTEGQFGTTRLEVAKEAAMQATEVLTKRDQVGVIAFDDAAKWVVPLQKVTDVTVIQSLIGTIRPGGGTAFYSALEQSVIALIQATTPQKHIIFLSDGQPADSGFQSLAQDAADHGITITTVAVGEGANAKLMELISTIGGGRTYRAGEFDNLPKIFTKETFLAGGSYVQNREFTPVITESSSMTAFDGFPKLQGYLTAMEKSLATVSLVTDQEDPLLAWWPYGAGTVVSWASDSEGAWTQDFLMWKDGPAFFGGLVVKTLAKEAKDGTLEVDVKNGSASIRYTLPEGTTVDPGIKTQATVLQPDGTEMLVELTQTEAGVFEGTFMAEGQGAYALRVEQEQEGATLRIKEGGTVVSFSEEYDLRSQSAEGVLEQLTQVSGGRMLNADDPLLSTQHRPASARRQITTLLCILTLILFLMDIALRRLSWEAAVEGWLQKMGTLQAEKAQKTQEKTQASVQEGKPSEMSGPVSSRQKQAQKPKAAVDTANKLLEAKRQRKQL
ncbi:MAG: VWA domain-containing protein [Clostridiales bacterium]|nr:VWA domain-containing protein [Clostridiales bacterium]